MIEDASGKLLTTRIGVSVPIVWFLVCTTDAFRAFTYSISNERPVAYGSLAAYAAGQTLFWTLLTFGLLWVVDRWPRRRAVAMTLAFLLLILGTIGIVLWHAFLFCLTNISKLTVSELFFVLLPRDFHGSLIIIVMVLGVGIALRDRDEAERRRLHESQLESQLLRAQLDEVTAQLQPHFLFNTLHSVAAVVHKDARLAERMVMGLGDLLRLSLTHAREDLGPLDDELYFVERYLFLLQNRLGDRLEVTIDASDEARRTTFPRFVLQPLVENAVKHGVESSDQLGTVAITAHVEGDPLVVEVRNSVAPNTPWRKDGVGLSSVKRRLALLYGTDYALDFTVADQMVTATLSVPAR